MAHKHYELIKTYYANPDWWDVYYKTPVGDWCLTSYPSWTDDKYELRKSIKHPDNKPKLKLVDMSKLPKGTMTNLGELLGCFDNFGYFLQDDRYLHDADWSDVRIAEQKTFTYWGGGECPVPDGLMVEVKHRYNGASREMAKQFRWNHLFNDSDVIGYRILAVAGGWSDDPSEAE